MISNLCKELIRTTLIESATATALIDDRAYPSQLALVSNPVYPCICFEPINSFIVDDGVTGTVDMRFWTSSERSYEECYDLVDVIHSTFHANRYVNQRIRIAGYLKSGPVEYRDEVLYYTATDYFFNCFSV